MKRVLITGASGFIGRNCLSDLVRSGYDVYAVALEPAESVDSGIKWQNVDLLDLKQTEKMAKDVKATHLLHFAWYAEPKKYWSSEENFKWVKASDNLLKAFYSHGGSRVVMAGTCAEYDWQYGTCFEDKTPIVPATIYGKCKNTLQANLAAFSKETGLSSAWGRIFFLYGPNEHSDRLVSSVIISLLQRKPVSCSHGKQMRDFLHVKDVASAFVALLESNVRGPVNIASGIPVALKDIICKIGEKIGHSGLIRFGDILLAKDEPALLVADVQRLREEVCWTPGYDIDSGIEQTIGWWKENIKKTKGG